MPLHLKIGDVFNIQQGKNILNKSSSKNTSSNEETYLLNLNCVDFDYHFIDKSKLLTYNYYSEKKDNKYVLLTSDFLINRVGTNCKTMSMLFANTFNTNEKILISQQFIFLRPKEIVSKIPLSYFHFVLEICIENLLKTKIGKNSNQQYITIKEIEDFKIPVNLLENNSEKDELFKNFEKLNNELNNSYSKVINSILSLNEQKTKLEKFKKDNFENAIELANKEDENK
jgi:hypothetical protein